MATIRRPSATQRMFYRIINPVMRFLVRRGAGGSGTDLLRTLRLRGRTTGRVYEVPVRVAVTDSGRYVMTMLGDTQWARNLRATGTAEILYRGRAEAVTARELLGEEKIRFLATLCRDRAFAARARSVLRSASGNRTKHLDDNAIRLLADMWHPFRLSPIDS